MISVDLEFCNTLPGVSLSGVSFLHFSLTFLFSTLDSIFTNEISCFEPRYNRRDNLHLCCLRNI